MSWTVFKHVGVIAMAVSLGALGASAGTLTFDLNNSFAANENAGISLTPNGGTLGATGYSFGANQGLSLASSNVGSIYSIDIGFHFDVTTGFRKIIDFKDLTSDKGLYVLNSVLDFFPGHQGTDSDITNGTDVVVRLTRTEDGIVTGYLNGVSQFSFARWLTPVVAGTAAWASHPLALQVGILRVIPGQEIGNRRA
jgi:hypothetical protein